LAYQKIEETFWTDPKVSNLSPNNKLLFIYLITNSHVHYSGLYYLPKVIIQDETGLSQDAIDKGLVSLTDGMMIRYDTDKKVIWIINMARYQISQGNKYNLIKGFTSQFNKLHKSALIKEFLIYYETLIDGILNPSEWDTEPIAESVAYNSNNNSNKRIFPPTQKKTRVKIEKKEWPHDEAPWLQTFLNDQSLFPPEFLLDYAWWEAISIKISGFNQSFIEKEWAGMVEWIGRNPTRAPLQMEKSIKRFISNWLTKAKENERRFKTNGN